MIDLSHLPTGLPLASFTPLYILISNSGFWARSSNDSALANSFFLYATLAALALFYYSDWEDVSFRNKGVFGSWPAPTFSQTLNFPSMDSIGKFIIATGLTIGGVIIATGVTVGGAVLGVDYMGKYWQEAKTKLFGKAIVIGTKSLPDSFPVEGIIFDTLVKANVVNMTATPIENSTNDAIYPGKDSGFGSE